ncbi:hypothetical protein LT01_00515 [Listeria monocytogenes]|nr:hypothetical protein [Listeria monocytogenes]EAC9918234.1 hypothetical protein [Listeria monocytogenes]
MCEYCNDDCKARTHIEMPEGHKIEIDNENDISIQADFDAYRDYLYFKIDYCPWCGRSLE